MSENSSLKMQLLQQMGNDIEKAKAAFKWLNEDKEQAPVMAQPVSGFPNGIYLILNGGQDMTDYVLFTPELQGSITSQQVNACTGIGIKQGDWQIVVDLHDQADGDDITLTTKKGSETYKHYKDNYLDAVADWQGKENTKHLIDIGLNERIELKENQYIPALGEMLFVFLNKKAVNQALEFVGGTPIADDWYWTSTEGSATNAWYLGLSYGFADGTTKASFTLRVRAVSAFIS